MPPTDTREDAEVGQAADRAGAIVSEQIHAMLDAAEARAREIRNSAEEDAREIRRGAAREVGTLFQKLQELESPLAAVVASLRVELDSLTSEFGRLWPHDDVIVVHAVPDEAEDEPEPPYEAEHEPEPPFAEREPEPVTEAEVVTSEADATHHDTVDATDEAADATDEAAELPAEDAPPPEEAPPAAQEEPVADEAPAKRGRLGWLKRRKSGTFISEPGQCAVCHRSLAAGSQDALHESGWKVSGEVGLCPDCQQDGWQLPDGARLPYRRAAGG